MDALVFFLTAFAILCAISAIGWAIAGVLDRLGIRPYDPPNEGSTTNDE